MLRHVSCFLSYMHVVFRQDHLIPEMANDNEFYDIFETFIKCLLFSKLYRKFHTFSSCRLLFANYRGDHQMTLYVFTIQCCRRQNVDLMLVFKSHSLKVLAYLIAEVSVRLS